MSKNVRFFQTKRQTRQKDKRDPLLGFVCITFKLFSLCICLSCLFGLFLSLFVFFVSFVSFVSKKNFVFLVVVDDVPHINFSIDPQFKVETGLFIYHDRRMLWRVDKQFKHNML